MRGPFSVEIVQYRTARALVVSSPDSETSSPRPLFRNSSHLPGMVGSGRVHSLYGGLGVSGYGIR